MREKGDGSCLQMHIRSGIRYLWTISNFNKFNIDQHLESNSLYFQNGEQRKSFNLKIIMAKPIHSDESQDETFFLHFNFKEMLLAESQYHIRYGLCDKYGQPVTKPETVELRIVNGKVGPFYLNFIAGNDLREKIQRHETLIVDVFILDVTFPSLYDVSTSSLLNFDRSNGNCHQNLISIEDDQEQSFCELYQQVSTSDVILIVKDQKFLAHKIVLVTKSPTFATFMLPILEKDHTLCMTIEDFDPAIVSKMLKYMYLNEVTIANEVVFEVYRIAKKYQVNGLVSKCLDRIVKSMNVDNAMTLYFFAVKHSIDSLIECTREFVLQNAAQVMDSGMFKRIINSYEFQTHGI